MAKRTFGDIELAEAAWTTWNEVCFDGELGMPDIRDNVAMSGTFPVDPLGSFVAEPYPWEVAMREVSELREAAGFGPDDAERFERAKANGIIAIAADQLPARSRENRTRFYWICEVMLHEMVHQWCHVKGIEDWVDEESRHTEAFRDAAMSHGLACFCGKPGDWSETEITDETAGRLYAALDDDHRALLLTPVLRDYFERRGVSFG